MTTTARGTYVYDQAAAKSVWVPAGTDHTTLPAASLAQMGNPALWTGGVAPAGAAPTTVTITNHVLLPDKAAYDALVAAGTAHATTAYYYPKA